MSEVIEAQTETAKPFGEAGKTDTRTGENRVDTSAEACVKPSDSMPGDDRERLIVELAGYLKTLKRCRDTVRKLRFNLRTFYAFLDRIGVGDVRAVTGRHVREYTAEILQSGITVGTVHTRISVVRRLYEYLEKNGRVLMNPAAGVPLPKRPPRLPKDVLSKTDIRKILEAPDTSRLAGIRDKAMLETFYSTGLRLGELCALTIYDVDTQNGYVRVNNGKGGKDRVVPLGYKARQYVGEYLRKIRGRFTEKNRDERALFVGSKGGRRIDPNFVRELVYRYAAQAGIKKRVYPHAFRHTCATHMLADGADITHVQQLLGHALLSSTQIYTQVAAREVKQTHAKTHPRERDADV